MAPLPKEKHWLFLYCAGWPLAARQFGSVVCQDIIAAGAAIAGVRTRRGGKRLLWVIHDRNAIVLVRPELGGEADGNRWKADILARMSPLGVERK